MRRPSGKAKKRKSTTLRVLEYLADHREEAASILGAAIWRDLKRGRIASTWGGGDYAMQMLLGRMRKQGLVATANTEGSSRWFITPKGRDRLAIAARAGTP